MQFRCLSRRRFAPGFVLLATFAALFRPDGLGGRSRAEALEPLVYTIRIAEPEGQRSEVEVSVPTEGRSSVELMIPVWTPGYYVVEDFAARVQDLSAILPNGTTVGVEKIGRSR